MIIRDKIFLRRKRDFGDIFGTVFTLLRRNFGVLCGSVFVVGGPFTLVAVVFNTFLRAEVLGERADILNSMFRHGSQYLSDMLSRDIHWYLLMLIVNLLPFAFARSAIANFFIVYERKNEGEQIRVNEIAGRAFRDGFRVYLGVLVFSIIAIAVIAVIALPMIMLGTVGNGVGVVFVFFIVFFAVLTFFPQLVYVFYTATWFSMVRDKVFVFKAIGNVFRTISGNFWWTWVLIVCIYLVSALLWAVVKIPEWIYSAFSPFSRMDQEAYDVSILYVAILAATSIVSQLVFCLMDMITAISYYSFEEEKTGAGLAMRIEQIGKHEENPNYQ